MAGEILTIAVLKKITSHYYHLFIYYTAHIRFLQEKSDAARKPRQEVYRNDDFTRK